MEKPRKMILDCPFCGEQPEKATAITPRGIIYFLECTNDKCPAHTVSVCGDHFEQSSINKWNTRAMSTWIEGEVPTKEEVAYAIREVIFESDEVIVQDPGHNADPNKRYISLRAARKLSGNVHALLTRKLKGKV